MLGRGLRVGTAGSGCDAPRQAPPWVCAAVPSHSATLRPSHRGARGAGSTSESLGLTHLGSAAPYRPSTRDGQVEEGVSVAAPRGDMDGSRSRVTDISESCGGERACCGGRGHRPSLGPCGDSLPQGRLPNLCPASRRPCPRSRPQGEDRPGWGWGRRGVRLEGGGDRPGLEEGPGAHLALAGAGADVAVCVLSVERVREEA